MSYFLGGIIGFFLCIGVMFLLTHKAYKNAKKKKSVDLNKRGDLDGKN